MLKILDPSIQAIKKCVWLRGKLASDTCIRKNKNMTIQNMGTYVRHILSCSLDGSGGIVNLNYFHTFEICYFIIKRTFIYNDFR